MEDFIELGIEGVDKVVDKHFHKIPDRYMHREGYLPKGVAPSNRHRSSSPASSTSSRELSFDSAVPDTQTTSREGFKPTLSPPPFQHSVPYDASGAPIYSTEPPRSRTQYLPDHEPYRNPTQTAQRPGPMARRSSSYVDVYRGRERDESLYRSVSDRRPRQRRGSSSNLRPPSRKVEPSRRTKDTKKDLKDRFTTSPEGIVGAGLGALVGGWATEKAQSGSRRNRKKGGTNDALTMLGAAIGGLAVNAAVDQWGNKR